MERGGIWHGDAYRSVVEAYFDIKIAAVNSS